MKSKQLKILAMVCSILGALVFSQPSQIFAGATPLNSLSVPATLYDDFETGYIEPSNWNNKAAVRKVLLPEEKLLMKATTKKGATRTQVPFANGSSINFIKTTINILEAEVDTGNQTCSYVALEGSFYNTKASGSTPDDVTGDIFAKLNIATCGNGLFAVAEVEEVLEDNIWGNRQVLQDIDIVAEGSLLLNTDYPAIIDYDPPTNTFTFTVGTISKSYTGPVKVRGPVSDMKRLLTQVSTDSPTGQGVIKALFDDVYIDTLGTVYDSFSQATLNSQKWRYLMRVRDVDNGKAHLARQTEGYVSQESLALTSANAQYIQATINLSPETTLIGGAWALYRIGGHYYNDTHGVGSPTQYNGQEGDVFVQIALKQTTDNAYSANAFFTRKRMDGSIDTTFLILPFTTKILPGVDYDLSIEQVGNKFIFKVNDETRVHYIQREFYPPSSSLRIIGTRVIAGPNQSGFAYATFDNIYVVRSGSISGQIHDSETQDPIQWVYVAARDDMWNFYGGAETNDLGYYQINNLPPRNDYRIVAYASWQGYITQYYPNTIFENSYTPVTVSQGNTTTGINFDLTTGGAISGQINDNNGDPIEGIEVTVALVQDQNDEVAWAQTNNDGTYRFGGVPEGKVHVEARSNGTYIGQFYPGALTRDKATQIAVVKDQEVTGINFVMETGGTISGVISADGNAPPDGWVDIYSMAEEKWMFFDILEGEINDPATGTWSIALPPGEYKLFAGAEGGSPYISQYYNSGYTFDTADIITVPLGETVSGIDFNLSSTGGEITGSTNKSNPRYGHVFVWSSDAPELDILDLSAGWCCEADPYSFLSAPGSWYVKGFNDINQNSRIDPFEPVAEYSNGPITMTNGLTQSNIDLTWLIPLDSDSDLMTDPWETLNTLNKDVDDAFDDKDGDFFCNLREFFSNTSAKDSTDIPPCQADDNSDRDSDGMDLLALTQELGRTNCSRQTPCSFDLDWDGDVDDVDFRFFMEDFGRSL